MGNITIIDIVLRLIGATVIGFAVGAQRAHASRPAGIRTHILVALGSCIVMITSCIMYYETIKVFGTEPSDPGRLGAQVINGIGFLGAGAILRDGFNVRGLTTAASVWIVACLGLAVGMGYFILSLIGTAMSFITLIGFDRIQQRLRMHKRPELDLQLENEDMGDFMVELDRLANLYVATIFNLSVERTEDNTYIVCFQAHFTLRKFKVAQSKFQQDLASIPCVIRMESHKLVM
ncbi:MAG: MgtC/SapB family protein [Lachnospiraceae bacterium]